MSAGSSPQCVDVATRIVGLVGGLIGAVGGFLGILSWVTARRREKRAREEQDEMWQLYIRLLESSKSTPMASTWRFEVGTREHMLAEMMVEKKLLDRLLGGTTYCLHGAVLESRYGDIG